MRIRRIDLVFGLLASSWGVLCPSLTVVRGQPCEHDHTHHFETARMSSEGSMCCSQVSGESEERDGYWERVCDFKLELYWSAHIDPSCSQTKVVEGICDTHYYVSIDFVCDEFGSACLQTITTIPCMFLTKEC